MWIYEKKLQYPVHINQPDPKMAKAIMSQLGGSDGELSASTRYLHQRYAMPYAEVKALLTDIATEEMAHEEMVSAMIFQLTQNVDAQGFEAAGCADYYVDHTAGIWPQAAAGIPFTSLMFQSKGDPITDLMEDLSAEQKARTTYENLLRLAKDPQVIRVLTFLREREIVHFERFGEALELVRKRLNPDNYYAFNPAFDKK